MDHGDQDEKRMGPTPEGRLVELKSADSGDQGEQDVPDEIEKVTLKTWVVVIALAVGYGSSYFSVPGIAITQGQLAAKFGQADKATWVVSVYTVAGIISMMTGAPNSDLLGRRWFFIVGNLLVVIGNVVAGSAGSFSQLVAGMAVAGFGGGFCQMATFAGPELLPNKWRPAAVVLADTFTIFDTIVGPIAGRLALLSGPTAWRWILYGPAIACGIVGIVLILFYFPPKHPRGLPLKQALRELDYVGGVLFAFAVGPILIGVIFASYVASTDTKVIAPLTSGFASLVAFACWETWAPLKQPLTPTRLFTHNKGRTLTAPFVVTLMVPIYYLGTNIVWATIIDAVLLRPDSPRNLGVKLSLPQGLGCMTGGVLLAFVGPLIQHWKWTQFAMVTGMTLFGGLLALAEPDRQGMMITFVYLGSTVYSWAQFLSIAYCQFGAPQTELGIAGGIAGVARFGGNCIATTVYVTILQTTLSKAAISNIVPAVVEAGGTTALGNAVLVALPEGAEVVSAIPGMTATIAAAAAAAWQQCYIKAIRTVALSSIAFGGLGMLACLWCEDITPKLNNKTEVFLENDVQADKNRFH